MKLVRQVIEVTLATFLLGLIWLLPVGWASAVGAGIGRLVGRIVGRILGEDRVAQNNLKLAFNEESDHPKSEAEREAILQAVWDNVGRNFGEIPHLGNLMRNADTRIEIIGGEAALAVQAAGNPIILVSGHFSNWHIVQIAANKVFGETASIYRRTNNPFVARLLDIFYADIAQHIMEKGRESVVGSLRMLKKKIPVLMLSDQHQSGGSVVEFFGKKVAAPNGAAVMGIRSQAVLIPMVSYRTAGKPDGAYFTVEFGEPLVVDTALSSRDAQADNLMQQFYAYLEEQIIKHPEHWLWLHARWSKYKPDA